MIKKYRKNTTEVYAIQFDGTDKSIKYIKKLLGKKSNKIIYIPNKKTVNGTLIFTIVGKNKDYIIYDTDWIVKDIYFFVVSNDVFCKMFKEIKK